MRASQWFISTLKETPNDAEISSHQFMLRAGLIRKLGSGLYTWLPLGLKVLRKIETIVREEMSAIYALEVLMPAIQPAELWQETGRWDTFGDLLLTMQDSNDRAYCFGPTHEEVITDLMRTELQSYKQLPVTFYQIQTKFRDEIRPRFGVMRAREFIMKDAYSFHVSSESLQKTYQSMYEAYCRIFDRMGLTYRAVEADTGAIGGSASHEFQVLADSGEDLIFYSDVSAYAANIEQATSLQMPKANKPADQTMSCVETPYIKTISELSHFLNVSSNQIIKTLIVKGKEHPMVALIIRGDDELNEVKAIKHPLIASPFQFVDEEVILKSLKVYSGSLGPVDLTIPIIVDHHALAMESFICGANHNDRHFINVSWDRDASYQEAFDLRKVKEGDQSPDGKGILRSCRGIEVGHIFQLGDKYAQAMHAAVINEEGHLQTMMMGCYGLGISRVVAATIEQHHDDKGIIWPSALAPFQVVIIPLNIHKSAKVQEHAQAIYQQLLDLGIDVLLDDRNERAGVLFADHDLIGIPHRLLISDRNLEQDVVEYKARATGETKMVELGKVIDFLSQLLIE
ncbi:MAG: proline--tRNA ligase [Legionella sp.]|nr:proline--tRNA ligase [Legionella sp.]